jgi:ATP-dependent helicase/nuclease subunit A
MVSDELKPADYQSRLGALDPKRCVCVTAPAGAGKTQLLSQRVLTLLANADQPEEILAITFTRKAAAEMHHRIIQALHMAKGPEPEQAHSRLSWQLAKQALARDEQCHWQLLDNPGRLKIQTIDSLCASLTKQMPILANFGAQPQIAENAQTYYRAAVHNFLQQLESDSAIADDLMSLLSHVDNDMQKVERLLMALLQRRDQWLLHIGMGGQTDAARKVLEHTLSQVITDVLRELQSAFRPIAADLLPLLDYAGCNLQWEKMASPITQLSGIIDLPGVDVSAVGQWRAIADILLKQDGGWRKSINKRVGFPTQTQEGDKTLAKALKEKMSQLLAELSVDDHLLATLQELRHLPSANYNPQQWGLLQSLTRLLPSLVAQLTLVFQQHGEVDYNQMAIAALDALGDGFNPTELALKLDHRLCHILVDEFQDTASTQYTLLERLIEGWQEHNVNHPERPNTLFIVGDGMQSIYGFREANVGLFLGARKNGVNGLHLDDLPLTVNFRSAPTIVNWINDTFGRAFPSVENLARGAVPFENAQAFKAHNESSRVQVFGFSGEQSRLNEAQKTVQLIQQAQKNNPTESIAVLVRSRSHLFDIIPAFVQAGLTWNATDIDPLSNVSSIIDLLSLTKALLNSADRVSWASLLRTPWMGLTNNDLHILLADLPTDTGESALNSRWQPIGLLLADAGRVERLSRHARQRLPVVNEILNAALSNRQRLTLRSWVEGVWLQLGGAASLTLREEFAAVDDYFDLLERYQKGAQLESIDEFEQAVHGLYAAPLHRDTELAVMTIHKSKGLEFDTVILPGLARAARSDDKSLLMWREYLPSESNSPMGQNSSPGLVISPLGATGSEEDSIYQHLRYEQAQASVLENTRLFYVAATRAVKRLYILFEAQRDKKKDEIKPPSKNSLLSCAWTALKDSVIWQEEPLPKNEQFGLDFDIGTGLEQLSRLPADWQSPQWKFNNPLQPYYLDADYTDIDPTNGGNQPDLQSDQLARSIGTVTHQILEQLAMGETQMWSTMDEHNKKQWLEALLHHAGLVTSAWPQALQEISRAVTNTVNDERGQWILSSSHLHASSEWKLLACFGSGVKQRIIDRSFIDKDGIRWIVDYKTSQPHKDETQAAFIERESQVYRSQLTEYAAYLKLMEAEKQQAKTIKVALYFTYFPHWEALSL